MDKQKFKKQNKKMVSAFKDLYLQFKTLHFKIFKKEKWHHFPSSNILGNNELVKSIGEMISFPGLP